MKEKVFEKVNEKVYEYTLDNGIKVFMYPFPKTKNFYITISVSYGSKYEHYRKGNKVYDIIPGSAHFLEHKVMAVSENKEISNRLNNLGSIVNAWTGFETTNYNIFGSTDVNSNIKLLLDIFYGPTFNKTDVEEEKGIISEEIDMGKDNINKLITEKLFKNLFHKAHVRNLICGEKTDIKKITPASLKKIYNDFYIANNSFIVVTGNFDRDEVIKTLKDYYKNKKLTTKEMPKYLKPREKESVRVNYEELKRENEEPRLRIGIKIKKSIFNVKDNDTLLNYLSIILRINFSSTSKNYEKYKNNKLAFNMSSNPLIVEDYVIISIGATTEVPDELLKEVRADFKKLILEKSEFERKKKNFLRAYIMSFENIEDVEYILTEEYSEKKKICYTDYSKLLNMNYEEAVRIMKLINDDNITVIKKIN